MLQLDGQYSSVLQSSVFLLGKKVTCRILPSFSKCCVCETYVNRRLNVECVVFLHGLNEIYIYICIYLHVESFERSAWGLKLSYCNNFVAIFPGCSMK
jgi:hypothetical protein